MWPLFLSLLFLVKADDSALYTSFQYILIDNETIALQDTRYNSLHFMNRTFELTLCYGEMSSCYVNPLYTPTLWVVQEYEDIAKTINLAQTLLIPILVFVADDGIPFYYTDDTSDTLIFTLPSSAAAKVANVPPNTLVTVTYDASINCAVTSIPTLICFTIFIVFLFIFIFRVGLWCWHCGWCAITIGLCIRAFTCTRFLRYW
eukprot:TRINITY_DN13093_c0_g1_i3.p2 TRINITY_DN13093_c0_g1~~TRINITY_DN13093_c0_g1_i3.p2  ORF type:complete len:203 (+),score=28.15 TRINITY_DN13093_c0_g1_i3:932-1540(+)